MATHHSPAPLEQFAGTPAAPGFLRLKQIIGDRRQGIEPLIPVSAATWWRGVKSGIYPRAHKISRNCTAWKRADVLAILSETDASPE